MQGIQAFGFERAAGLHVEDAFQKASLREGIVQRLLSCLLRDVGCEEEVERTVLVVKRTDLQGSRGVECGSRGLWIC